MSVSQKSYLNMIRYKNCTFLEGLTDVRNAATLISSKIQTDTEIVVFKQCTACLSYALRVCKVTGYKSSVSDINAMFLGTLNF